jgi:hypothetical protein
MGTIYCEKMELISSPYYDFCNEQACSGWKIESPAGSAALMEICCIVQCGQGNEIARTAIEFGSTVPAVTLTCRRQP